MNIPDFSPGLQKSTSAIAAEICEQYDKGLGVFARKVNAEDLAPNTILEDKIQFLFWVIQMDYATKSASLYKNANDLWWESPNWIDTKSMLSLSDGVRENLIKSKLKPRYAAEISKRFKVNAALLEQEYNGLAMNMVKQSVSANDLLERIKKFRGFGAKLANYLLRTYVDLAELKFADIDEILPPVDVHDVRLSYEWGLLENKEMTDKNISDTKQIWSSACKKAGVSWVKFDKALWLIGSEGLRDGDIPENYKLNVGIVSK